MSNQTKSVVNESHHDIADFLIGNSLAIKHVRKLVAKAANSDVSVLVLGGSGSGKEVVAKCLHYQSKRKDYPFIPVNCGAIPAELLESELFGHEKGAFTGAYAQRIGRFEQAKGGTVFLDEIGDMPFAMQVKLLRVLQERCFDRVGGTKSIETNVRIIAATHCQLEQAILDNKFREDLYYRLNVFPIEMPALKDRIEDLPLLLQDLITKMSEKHDCTINMTATAIKALTEYSWPGNIRELANLVERLMVLYPHGTVDVADLPIKYRQEIASQTTHATPIIESVVSKINQPTFTLDSGVDLKQYLMDIELSCIKQALEQSGGVVVRAAEYLKMRRTTLVEKMRKYQITRLAGEETTDSLQETELAF